MKHKSPCSQGKTKIMMIHLNMLRNLRLERDFAFYGYVIYRYSSHFYFYGHMGKGHQNSADEIWARLSKEQRAKSNF